MVKVISVIDALPTRPRPPIGAIPAMPPRAATHNAPAKNRHWFHTCWFDFFFFLHDFTYILYFSQKCCSYSDMYNLSRIWREVNEMLKKKILTFQDFYLSVYSWKYLGVKYNCAFLIILKPTVSSSARLKLHTEGMSSICWRKLIYHTCWKGIVLSTRVIVTNLFIVSEHGLNCTVFHGCVSVSSGGNCSSPLPSTGSGHQIIVVFTGTSEQLWVRLARLSLEARARLAGDSAASLWRACHQN